MEENLFSDMGFCFYFYRAPARQRGNAHAFSSCCTAVVEGCEENLFSDMGFCFYFYRAPARQRGNAHAFSSCCTAVVVGRYPRRYRAPAHHRPLPPLSPDSCNASLDCCLFPTPQDKAAPASSETGTALSLTSISSSYIPCP